jgi:hypothetical protein
MRRLRWALLGVLALVATESAQAQTAGNFQTALTGVSPSAIQFKPIDTTNAMQGASGVVTAGTSNSLSINSFFRRFLGLGSAPVRGVSNIPAAQYRAVFAPLPPISSTVPTTR